MIVAEHAITCDADLLASIRFAVATKRRDPS